MSDVTERARLVVRDEYGSRLCFSPGDFTTIRNCDRGKPCACAAIARVVICAIREPTEGMVIAGCDLTATNANRAEVGNSWRAMIDEAMKEPSNV